MGRPEPQSQIEEREIEGERPQREGEPSSVGVRSVIHAVRWMKRASRRIRNRGYTVQQQG